jgi:hypothetical protein
MRGLPVETIATEQTTVGVKSVEGMVGVVPIVPDAPHFR